MKTGGFITLHRQILDWEWYQNINTFRVFLHCLLMANYSDGRFEGKEIKRGQFVTSLAHLSKQTKLTVKEVRTALDHLIGTGELASQTFNRFRIITVVKYDVFQTEGNQIGKQTASKGQAKGKQTASKGQQYNNNNNNNKETMEQGNNNISCLFDQFWSVYPRKESKLKAKTAFDKIRPDEEVLQRMLASIEKWKGTSQWQEDGGRYVPHPATWLNQRRWEDDVPSPAPQHKQKVIPAQDFQQRSYDGVEDEMVSRLAKEMARFKATGEVDM